MGLWVCPKNDLRGTSLNVLGQGVNLIKQFLRPSERIFLSPNSFLHTLALCPTYPQMIDSQFLISRCRGKLGRWEVYKM